jgi:hypothetical protein
MLLYTCSVGDNRHGLSSTGEGFNFRSAQLVSQPCIALWRRMWQIQQEASAGALICNSSTHLLNASPLITQDDSYLGRCMHYRRMKYKDTVHRQIMRRAVICSAPQLCTCKQLRLGLPEVVETMEASSEYRRSGSWASPRIASARLSEANHCCRYPPLG